VRLNASGRIADETASKSRLVEASAVSCRSEKLGPVLPGELLVGGRCFESRPPAFADGRPPAGASRLRPPAFADGGGTFSKAELLEPRTKGTGCLQAWRPYLISQRSPARGALWPGCTTEFSPTRPPT